MTKQERPYAVPGFTIARRSHCGKIYTTVTISPVTNKPMEVFHDLKMTHCPFHEDHNPSMALYGNRVHCFVCNRSWDAIDSVMERQGLKFREAVRHLTTEIR